MSFPERSFSLLAQRKRTKRKGSLSLAVSLLVPHDADAGLPCAPQNDREFEKLATLRQFQTLIPVVPAVLGRVKWQNRKMSSPCIVFWFLKKVPLSLLFKKDS